MNILILNMCKYVSFLMNFFVSVVNRWRFEPKECVVGRDDAGYIYRI